MIKRGDHVLISISTIDLNIHNFKVFSSIYFLYFSERSIKEEDANIQTKVEVSKTVVKADSYHDPNQDPNHDPNHDSNHDPNHKHDHDLTESFLNTDSNTNKESSHKKLKIYLNFPVLKGLLE